MDASTKHPQTIVLVGVLPRRSINGPILIPPIVDPRRDQAAERAQRTAVDQQSENLADAADASPAVNAIVESLPVFYA